MQLRERGGVMKPTQACFLAVFPQCPPGAVLAVWACLPVAKKWEKKDNATMCLSESVFLGWEKGNVRYRKSMLHHTGNYELLLICMQNSVLQQRSHSGQHCLLRQSSHNLLNLWIKGEKKKRWDVLNCYIATFYSAQ